MVQIPRTPPTEIPFPQNGFVEGLARSKQPPQTYADGQNVVPIDVLERRVRGGSRAGLSRYVTSSTTGGQVNGSNLIQNLQRAVGLATGATQSGAALFQDDFTGTAGVDIETRSGWADEYVDAAVIPGIPFNIGSNFGASTDGWELTGSGTGRVTLTGAGNNQARAILLLIAGAVPGVFRPTNTVNGNTQGAWKITLTTDSTLSTADSARYFVGIVVHATVVSPGTDMSDDNAWAVGWHFSSSGQRLVISNFETIDTLEATHTLTGADATDGAHVLEVIFDGFDVTVRWDGVVRITYTVSEPPGNPNLFFEHGLLSYRLRNAASWSADTVLTFDTFSFNEVLATEAGEHDADLVVTTGGNIYSGKADDDPFPLALLGTAAVASDRLIESILAFDRVFFCDGVTYKFLRLFDNTVFDWVANPGDLPGGDGGVVNGQERARIIALHDGRIFLSRKFDETAEVFYSAIADPDNWNFGTVIDGAGTLTTSGANLGDAGDIVTALAPHARGRLVVGCERSVLTLVGNPQATDGSAALITLSREVGIVGPRAWTVAPDQTLFFIGPDGLYGLRPNDFDIDKSNKVSELRLDRTFGDLDFAANQIQLLWDVKRDGLYIFITPTAAAGATTHFFWHRPTNSFHPWAFPNDVGPTSVLSFDDTSAGERKILLGGFDSRVRRLDDAATDDDGTPLTSFVQLGPFRSPWPGREFGISGLEVVLDEDSGALSFEVRAADTPEAALSAPASYGGQFTAGRNPPVWSRARGAAAFLRLSSTNRWALESIHAVLAQAGRTRPR